MPGTDDLVTVASYPTVLEAETVRGILERSGIRSVLVDAHLMTYEPWWGLALGNVGLQVLRSDAPRAVEILREHQAEAAGAEDADGEVPENSCIACGAEIPGYLDRCPACGWSYS